MCQDTIYINVFVIVIGVCVCDSSNVVACVIFGVSCGGIVLVEYIIDVVDGFSVGELHSVGILYLYV